ncbi:hypothetical protein SFOMI_4885 [Sphingobium fuliginis]|uniref:Uncharacterized protein n=1 Tax=Sphingobium fuliginis (strain ATCC 27551) TaxID=336203 RepID=A0A292ZN73_SPHSA|nr:hypothetical protein SFOMI_4885 [Sphingobium fuliginis]
MPRRSAADILHLFSMTEWKVHPQPLCSSFFRAIVALMSQWREVFL